MVADTVLGFVENLDMDMVDDKGEAADSRWSPLTTMAYPDMLIIVLFILEYSKPYVQSVNLEASFKKPWSGSL